MELTEKQASLLIEKVIVRRPCVNCGITSQENNIGTILKIVKMPAIIPVVETGNNKSEDILLTFSGCYLPALWSYNFYRP